MKNHKLLQEEKDARKIKTCKRKTDAGNLYYDSDYASKSARVMEARLVPNRFEAYLCPITAELGKHWHIGSRG